MMASGMQQEQLEIVTWPAPVLETRAEEITEFGDELRAFGEAMHATMQAAHGIGLAANQVGVLKRILVIEIPWDGKRYGKSAEPRRDWHDRRYTIVNPEIVEREGTIIFNEGCLSFPELFGEVERARRVLVKAQDVDGRAQVIEGDDLLAVCLQHEIDHLNGIVFINHMTKLSADAIRQKMRTEPT